MIRACGLNHTRRCDSISTTGLGTGYFIQELLGCEIRYQESGNPLVISPGLTERETAKLECPANIDDTEPMRRLIALMDHLESEYGYLVGDVPMHSVVNVSLDLRGQHYFIDLIENPDLAMHIHEVIAQTIVKVGSYIKKRTGTTSTSLIRIIAGIHPDLLIIPNCNNQMISPTMYHDYLMDFDRWIGEQLPPMGIHHCGNNAELFARMYADCGAQSLDVGVGSDIRECREAFPEKWLYLRMDPVKMQKCTPDETVADLDSLLKEHGEPLNRVGINCNNIDFGTPDESIRDMFLDLERRRGDRTTRLREAYERC